jgi:nitrite reductase/ring-hydroxylating ferredoxin subunit
VYDNANNGHKKPTDSDRAAGESTWRREFPTEWTADNYNARREFTKFLVLGSGMMFLGSGYFAAGRGRAQAAALPNLPIASVDEIAPGGVKQFRYPTEDDLAILVRLRDDSFVAYHQRCTHLSCPVHFNAQRSRLECPCHEGAFDAATGNVLEGPPPRPLSRIALRIDNGKIFAVGMEE